MNFELHNGVKMFPIGAGCAYGNWTGTSEFQGFLPEEAHRATELCLRSNIRRFDGARAYGTERHVGNVIGRWMSEGKLVRSDLFVTTKLFHPAAPPHIAISHLRTWNPRDVPDIKQRILDDMDKSLDDIGFGYFDLVLMHWSGSFDEKDPIYARNVRKQIWEVFESFLAKGTAKAIGVSNFNQKHLEQLIEDCKVVPMVNQVEMHPYCQNKSLVSFCRSHKILVEAYAPFASGAFGMLTDPVLTQVCKEVGKSVGQVILRWLIQQGIAALPKSSSEKRMIENNNVYDFELNNTQMDMINELGSTEKRSCPDPDTIL